MSRIESCGKNLLANLDSSFSKKKNKTKQNKQTKNGKKKFFAGIFNKRSKNNKTDISSE